MGWFVVLLLVPVLAATVLGALTVRWVRHERQQRPVGGMAMTTSWIRVIAVAMFLVAATVYFAGVVRDLREIWTPGARLSPFLIPSFRAIIGELMAGQYSSDAGLLLMLLLSAVVSAPLFVILLDNYVPSRSIKLGAVAGIWYAVAVVVITTALAFGFPIPITGSFGVLAGFVYAFTLFLPEVLIGGAVVGTVAILLLPRRIMH